MRQMEYQSGMRQRRGSVLLICLLVLLILGLLWWYKRSHGPVYQIGKGKSDIAVPWRQWDAIRVRREKGRPPGLPGAQQPQLSKPLGIEARASEEDKPRGLLQLLIMPDGSVQGQWGGQYRISKYVDYQVMGCRFNGLVDPELVYSDDEGEDPSKLFFISKGPFSILETNDDNGKVRSLGGHIYVRGWLSLDNSIDGEIILTNDEQNFYLYTWKGKCEEGGLSLF